MTGFIDVAGLILCIAGAGAISVLIGAALCWAGEWAGRLIRRLIGRPGQS